MTLKLDKRDRRLLLELDLNCRRPLKELAKITGAAIETTRYRIERLHNLGVIKNFLTVIDGGRLGFYYYKVFIRFFNVSEEKIQEIAQALANDPCICWVIRVDGNFDIGFTPRVRTPSEQGAILDRLRWKYSKYIRHWTLSVNLRMDFLSRDYLIGAKSRPAVIGSYSSDKPHLELDSSAQLVLNELAKDPQSSAASIAKKAGISTDVVLSRIKFIEREKVIVRYSLVTDSNVLEHVNFYVLIYLNNVTPAREKAFVRFCHMHPNIVYIIKSLGEWDYELSIETPTIAKYREVMMTITKDFSDIVQEYNAMRVDKLVKYVYP